MQRDHKLHGHIYIYRRINEKVIYESEPKLYMQCCRLGHGSENCAGKKGGNRGRSSLRPARRDQAAENGQKTEIHRGEDVSKVTNTAVKEAPISGIPQKIEVNRGETGPKVMNTAVKDVQNLKNIKMQILNRSDPIPKVSFTTVNAHVPSPKDSNTAVRAFIPQCTSHNRKKKRVTQKNIRMRWFRKKSISSFEEVVAIEETSSDDDASPTSSYILREEVKKKWEKAHKRRMEKVKRKEEIAQQKKKEKKGVAIEEPCPRQPMKKKRENKDPGLVQPQDNRKAWKLKELQANSQELSSQEWSSLRGRRSIDDEDAPLSTFKPRKRSKSVGRQKKEGPP